MCCSSEKLPILVILHFAFGGPMENIESLIAGSEKLTNIFGYWPSFYDAEVLELHFDRGDIQPAKGIYKFPVLIFKIHLGTNEES
jgi:hypothetical protein